MERGWLIGLAVCAGVVGSDPTELAATQETVHPVADYLIRPPAPVEVIRLAQPSSASPPSPRSVVAAVGVLDGPESETFGEIVDVVTDEEGRVYVLDGHYRQVRVYDSALVHQQTVGAEGPGPGEFRSPRALALTAAGKLFVFDYDGNVDIFAVDAGRLAFDRALKLPLGVAGACALGDELIVSGHAAEPSNTAVLFRVAPTGEILGGFGEVYDSPSPLVNFQMAGGAIACLPQRGMIVQATAPQLAELRGYDTSGRLVWITELEGLEGMRVSTNGGRTRVQLPETGIYQYVASLAASPNDALLVSIVHNTRTGRTEGLPYVAVQTLRVDPTSGTGESLGWRLPQIAAFAGDQPVTVVVAPFPRLIKLRETRSRGGVR